MRGVSTHFSLWRWSGTFACSVACFICCRLLFVLFDTLFLLEVFNSTSIVLNNLWTWLRSKPVELAARLPMLSSWRSLARDTDMDVASVAKHVDEAGEKLSQQPQEPGERAPLPGKGNFVQQFKDVLSAGDVGHRASVGQSFAQHFRKKKNHDANAKYDALKTPGGTQRLKEFSLNWAKDNLEAITEVGHRLEESWSRVQGGAWRVHAARKDRAEGRR